MLHEPFEQPWAHGIFKDRYAHPGEEWFDTAARVARYVMGALLAAPTGHQRVEATLEAEARVRGLMEQRLFIPGGRYLYAVGRDLHQTQNCLLLRCEDSREGWADLSWRAEMALMTGAGIGAYYGDVRACNEPIRRTGGVATGPIAKMKAINELGRSTIQGGMRRSAIWAGLPWTHPDVFDFMRAKDWPQWLRDKKNDDPNVPAPLDMTNISVCLDEAFFFAYDDAQHPLHSRAREVYRQTLDKALTTGEPGFSIDMDDQVLRNACTEIVSADDSDVCNLGSLNLARFHDVDQFRAAVRDATLFLLAGTLYSHLPYAKVAEVRERNRRLGLGLMGVHEWLIQRGRPYGPDEELGQWLDVYRDESDRAAEEFAAAYGLSEPIARRAIAPNGTISIVGETSSGCEAIIASAYKRLIVVAGANGNHSEQYEYVIDPVAKRALDRGVPADQIQDAYGLAETPEVRIAFQAWLQPWVDQAISSTINLPGPIRGQDEQNLIGAHLYKHLRGLRGVTFYPDGARGHQPLNRVPLEEAVGKTGVRYESDEATCSGSVCSV